MLEKQRTAASELAEKNGSQSQRYLIAKIYIPLASKTTFRLLIQAPKTKRGQELPEPKKVQFPGLPLEALQEDPPSHAVWLKRNLKTK